MEKEITHYRYEREYPLFDNKYKLRLEVFDVIKETKHGYWISQKGFSSWKKFVLKVSAKRYAYPTKEQALNNFILRTRSAKKYAEANLKHANAFIEAFENFKIES